MKKSEELADVYEQIFTDRSILVNKRDPQWRFLEKFLSENSPQSILDLGCGDGVYTEKICGEVSADIIGVDLLRPRNVSFEFRQESLDQVDFQPGTFDLIIGLSSFHYSENLDRLLVSCFHMLKSNGAVLITNHTKYSLPTIIRVLGRILSKERLYPHLNGVNFWAIGYLTTRFEQAGFDVVETCGWRFESRAERLLRKLMKRVGISLDVYSWLGNGIKKGILAETSYHSMLLARKRSVE